MAGERGDSNERATDEGVSRRRGRPCPRCEAPMFKRHCKYVCPQHGVIVDCSDPFTF